MISTRIPGDSKQIAVEIKSFVAYAKKVADRHEHAKKLVQEAGIVDARGRLTKHYR